MHAHALRRPALATQPTTGLLQPAWRHRLLAWARGLAMLLMLTLLPGWATAQTDSWSGTGAMGTARYWHTATQLPNGKVLVAGGYNGSSYFTSAELYDPATGTWSSTGSMGTARARYTATLLPNGKVLVAGGYNGSSLSSAELYDPATGTWSSTGAMANIRYLHTATLLPSGKLLVAGGANGSILASAELYTPAPVANPTPVPTLGQWALALLSLIAAALGAGALRRKTNSRQCEM